MDTSLHTSYTIAKGSSFQLYSCSLGRLMSAVSLLFDYYNKTSHQKNCSIFFRRSHVRTTLLEMLVDLDGVLKHVPTLVSNALGICTCTHCDNIILH